MNTETVGNVIPNVFLGRKKIGVSEIRSASYESPAAVLAAAGKIIPVLSFFALRLRRPDLNGIRLIFRQQRSA